MQDNYSLSSILSLIDKYSRQLIVAGLVVAGLTYGVYHRRQSQFLQEQAATSSLLETLEELERAYSSTGDWKEVDIASKTGLQSHKSSQTAPYFMLIQAQALAQQGQTQEAIDLLDTVINLLPKNVSLRFLVMTTQAQMKIDMQDAALVENGIEQLEQLSNDPKNIYKDKALYLLRAHYQMQGNIEKAEDVAKKLHEFISNEKESSPWAQQAATM